MKNELYSVAIATSKKINVIKARNGVVVNNFSINGELVSGPLVVGNNCTYVIQTPSGQKQGFVRMLPSGAVVNRFSA
jgi:hypothetical protein|tara:strand:+ start:237 stop:467 length:231 start_codon:yes stop_codon:yes gene_type:complete